jgi:hypothetical protein
MTDSSVADQEEEEVFIEPPKEKKPKKKRVLTEEQKEKLKEQLNAGRQKALENTKPVMVWVSSCLDSL